MSWNLNLGSLNWLNPSTSPSPNKPKKQRRPIGKKSAPKHKGRNWRFRSGAKKKLTAMEKLARIAEVDQELSQEAPTRWRPDITTKDKKFESRLASFERMLSSDDMSLQKILDTIFAPEERQLLLPINPERNPPLAKIQEANTRQFEELLRSDPFKDLDPETTNPTALKLTLAYFGIPTGPIAPFESMAWVFDDEMSDGERDLPLLPPRVRNARFANKYTRRLYAYDHSRSADPFLESYYAMDVCYAPPQESIVPESVSDLTLRGGGGDNASLGLRGGGDDDASLSLRGGADGDDDDDYLYENYTTTLDGDRPKKYTGWMTLYGYQGQVAFEPSSLNTFVDAVDRLLGLDCRAGVMYQVHMRHRRAKPTKSSWQTQVALCQGVGNFEADQKILDWIREQLPNYAPGADDITTNMILFVSGVADPIPSHCEPHEQDRVLKFELVWPDNPALYRADIAYLRVPRNMSSVKYVNQYHNWMASICRLLGAGQIPFRPGRPSVPNAHFSIKGYAPGGRHVGSYGGLVFLPELWASITKSWKANPKQSVMLSARNSTKDLGDRLFLFLPGNSQPLSTCDYIPLSQVSRRNFVELTILESVKRSMSGESYKGLSGVEITLPGDLALVSRAPPVDLFLPVPTGDEGSDQDKKGPIVSRLETWLNYLNAKKIVAPAENGFQMYPQFLTLQPKFTTYRIYDARKLDGPSTVWHPNEVSLQTFRTMAKRVLGLKNAVDANSIYIEYRQTPKPPTGQKQLYGKPKFLIGPETTDDEWRIMQKWIVEPNAYLSRLDESAKPAFGKQPFGFNDIYSAPAGKLYGGLKEEYQPEHKRYHDYQMWQANASIQLPTREPEGKAREKAKAPEKAQKTSTSRFKITQPGHSLGFLNDPSFTTLQKALQLREYSYFHPLDIHISNSIPINAPPLETIVSVGKDSTPKLALGVLTPSEVRRLRQDYFTLRNVLLDRTQTCRYAGCKQTYGVTQKLEFQQHLNEAHGAKEKCPFCDDLLFSFYTESQRGQHIAQTHPNMIPGLQDAEQDDEEPTEPSPPPNPNPVVANPTTTTAIPDDFDPVATATGPSPRLGEDEWRYCARCGRDHALLSEPRDRLRHDQICHFGVLTRKYLPPKGPGHWEACPVCAAYIPKSAEGRHPQHKAGPHPDAPYCFLCGIGLGVFGDEDYGNTHMGFCKGYGSDRVMDYRYCPWCKLGFGKGEESRAVEWLVHVRACTSAVENSSIGNSPTYATAVAHEEQQEQTPKQKKIVVDSDSDADGEYIEPKPKKTKKSAAAKQPAESTGPGPTTRSQSGAKKTVTWKVQEGAAPSSKKGPGIKKKGVAAGAAGTLAYPMEMDLDEPELPAQTGRKVSFNDVVEVKEIEPIKKRKTSAAGTSSEGGAPAKKKKKVA